MLNNFHKMSNIFESKIIFPHTRNQGGFNNISLVFMRSQFELVLTQGRVKVEKQFFHVMSLSDRFTFAGDFQDVDQFPKTARPFPLGYAAVSCALSPFALFVFTLLQQIFNLICCLTAAAALSSAEQVLLFRGHPHSSWSWSKAFREMKFTIHNQLCFNLFSWGKTFEKSM